MVQDQNRNADIDRAVASGRDNRAVRSDVEGWCKHICVKTITISMLGEMVGEPIGPHRISCMHARHSIESGLLRGVFDTFLVDNCAKCEFYSQGQKPRYGESRLNDLIAAKESAEAARQTRRDTIENLRSDLIALASTTAPGEDPNATSVLRLTAELFSENAQGAAISLRELCAIASDLFSEKVLKVLEHGVKDEAFASNCLQVFAGLAKYRPSLRPRIRGIAIDSLTLSLPIDVVAETFAETLGEDDQNDSISETIIEAMLTRQNYQRPIGGWEDGIKPTYPSAMAVLSRACDLNESILLSVIGRCLETEDKWQRANVCDVLCVLVAAKTALGIKVLPKLIRSLEQNDDIYNGFSADGSALRAITNVLADNWDAAHGAIQCELKNATVDAFATILGAYERLFRRGANWREETSEGLSEAACVGAVEYALSLVMNADLEPVVRRSAVEVIQSACRAGVPKAMESFDQLLGCLTLIVEAKRPLPRKPTIIIPGQEEAQNQQRLLEEQARQHEWQRLKKELEELIEAIGKQSPISSASTLLATIETARAEQRPGLQVNALRLIGQLAEGNSEVCLMALPCLMVSLMDYSSTLVRSAALRALRAYPATEPTGCKHP